MPIGYIIADPDDPVEIFLKRQSNWFPPFPRRLRSPFPFVLLSFRISVESCCPFSGFPIPSPMNPLFCVCFPSSPSSKFAPCWFFSFLIFSFFLFLFFFTCSLVLLFHFYFPPVEFLQLLLCNFAFQAVSPLPRGLSTSPLGPSRERLAVRNFSTLATPLRSPFRCPFQSYSFLFICEASVPIFFFSVKRSFYFERMEPPKPKEFSCFPPPPPP